jgi:hypothetical protein
VADLLRSAGNRLDQNRTQPNNQQKEWTFTTGGI